MDTYAANFILKPLKTTAQSVVSDFFCESSVEVEATLLYYYKELLKIWY